MVEVLNETVRRRQ